MSTSSRPARRSPTTRPSSRGRSTSTHTRRRVRIALIFGALFVITLVILVVSAFL